MKTTRTLVYRAILTLTATLGVIIGTAGLASAHDGQWDHRHHYYRDNYGYWDNHDHYRHYETWHSHRGYWDTRSHVRVFINVD